MLTFILLLREDREIELLLKLDDFEMRDHPNKRMISHFNKSIGVTRSRIVVVKKRLNELTIEYEGIKARECTKNKKKKKIIKTKIKNKTSSSDDESSSKYLEMLDTDDDDELDDGEEVESRDDIDDVIEVQDMDQCNLELDFDGTSSRITSVDIDLNSSNDSI